SRRFIAPRSGRRQGCEHASRGTHTASAASTPQSRRARPAACSLAALSSAVYLRAMPSTIRFLKQYLRPTEGATVETETVYTRGAEELPATVYRPMRGPLQLPGWVVLHGL